MVSHAAIGEGNALEEVCETIRQRSSFQSKTENRVIFLSWQRHFLLFTLWGFLWGQSPPCRGSPRELSLCQAWSTGQGPRLVVFGEEKILCMELCSVSPVQPAPGVSRSSPLVCRRSQSQGGQTSPHDSFCSNGLQQNKKRCIFQSGIEGNNKGIPIARW